MWVKASTERIVLIGSILSIFDRLSETFIVNIIIVVLLNLFYSSPYTSKFFNGKEECDRYECKKFRVPSRGSWYRLTSNYKNWGHISREEERRIDQVTRPTSRFHSVSLLKSWGEIGETRLISWFRLMNEAPSCCNTVINGDSIRLQLGYYVTFFSPLSFLFLATKSTSVLISHDRLTTSRIPPIAIIPRWSTVLANWSALTQILDVPARLAFRLSVTEFSSVVESSSPISSFKLCFT